MFSRFFQHFRFQLVQELGMYVFKICQIDAGILSITQSCNKSLLWQSWFPDVFSWKNFKYVVINSRLNSKIKLLKAYKYELLKIFTNICYLISDNLSRINHIFFTQFILIWPFRAVVSCLLASQTFLGFFVSILSTLIFSISSCTQMWNLWKSEAISVLLRTGMSEGENFLWGSSSK